MTKISLFYVYVCIFVHVYHVQAQATAHEWSWGQPQFVCFLPLWDKPAWVRVFLILFWLLHFVCARLSTPLLLLSLWPAGITATCALCLWLPWVLGSGTQAERLACTYLYPLSHSSSPHIFYVVSPRLGTVNFHLLADIFLFNFYSHASGYVCQLFYLGTGACTVIPTWPSP